MIKLHRTKVINRRGYYIFQCECGNLIELRGDSKAKFCYQECCTKSRPKHLESNTRLYSIWGGMRSRCIGKDKSNTHYKEKGISIAPEWSDFLSFKSWAMSNGYNDTLTLDRKNINGNYEPSNCEWITRSENTKRQNADYHGGHKQIIVTNQHSNTIIEFKSVNDAAKYIIENGYSSSNNISSVSTTISGVLTGRYYLSYAYNHTFQYKEVI